MIDSARWTACEIEGCKAVYIQSDEVTFLLTDYENVNTQGWFAYNVNKLVSITASLMSVNLSRLLGYNVCFDARAFNVPREDVANAFLWRMKDWRRNSIQMLAQSMFSHKDLHKKSIGELQLMTSEAGMNWFDLEDRLKYGTWLIKDKPIYFGGFDIRSDIYPHYNDVAKILNPFMNISLDKVDGL
jgi:tRNA(His) guanylyltransferase